MKTQSAIMQMIMGIRGQIDSVVLSEENREAVHAFNQKYRAFKEKYADNPEIIKLFDEICNAHDADQATSEEDHYISGFSFGVLMGIDIMRINLKND